MQKYVIALYIRLSLEDYKYDSMSIENQHLALNEFISSMPESTNAESEEGHVADDVQQFVACGFVEVVQRGEVS